LVGSSQLIGQSLFVGNNFSSFYINSDGSGVEHWIVVGRVVVLGPLLFAEIILNRETKQ
jgi:hypothetical protein